jgi:hypothetical protein
MMMVSRSPVDDGPGPTDLLDPDKAVRSAVEDEGSQVVPEEQARVDEEEGDLSEVEAGRFWNQLDRTAQRNNLRLPHKKR